MENKNKYVLYLSYLSFLVFIPNLQKEKTDFEKFHIKQGFVLFIYQVALSVVDFIASFLTKIDFPLYPLIVVDYVIAIAWLMYLTMLVFGVLNITKGLKRKLPLIGKFIKESGEGQ